MPAVWQSSQRPMYIRTVWVDGFRHAILTHDDPHFLKLCARRRPHSSTSYITKPRRIQSSLSEHNDIDDLRKLHFVIRSNKVKKIEPTENIEKLNLSDVESSADDCEDNVSRVHGSDCKLRRDWENMRAVKSNRTARNEVKENTELSDRVLQWLDLAGKIDLLAPDDVERISQQRHSWPEIQRRNLIKSKTATELRTKEIKPSADTKTSGNIDRSEYLPTSANTIENYARQSRSGKSTQQRHDMKKDNKKVKDMRADIIQARQKVATEKSAIEKQYSDMISKNMIPNVEKTKKQVHIFMPEAITKKSVSNSTSRTESLISQAQ